MSYSLSSIRARKGVVLFSVDGIGPVASFPAEFNGHKMPTPDECAALCGFGTAGTESVEMTDDQLTCMLQSVPTSGYISLGTDEVSVGVRNKKRGVWACPLVARRVGDVWLVFAPVGMLIKTVA